MTDLAIAAAVLDLERTQARFESLERLYFEGEPTVTAAALRAAWEARERARQALGNAHRAAARRAGS